MSASFLDETELLDEDRIQTDDVPEGFEFVDGELVEIPQMGAESSIVAGRIFRKLDDWCESHRSGIAITAEAAYRCFSSKPRQVRKPDVSVIVCNPDSFAIPKGELLVVPSLVVEVVSPNETMDDVMRKIEDFLEAGTPLAWVVQPQMRQAFVHRPNGTVSKFRDPAELSGEDVLPGFRVALADFLPRIPNPKSENPAA